MARIGSHAAHLKKGDGSVSPPESFTSIAQVLSISGPSLSRETIDTTDADSTNDWRTFIASYIDGGEITLEINYDPDTATHETTAGILEDFGDAIETTPTKYQLEFPTSPVTNFQFSASVTGFETSAPHDGVLTASVTYKVMGAVTLT